MKTQKKPPKRAYRKQPPLPQVDGLDEEAVKMSRRVQANRENGRKGGLVTAARYPSREFREARGRKGGLAQQAKLGHEYYSFHFKRVWAMRRAKKAGKKKRVRKIHADDFRPVPIS